MLHAFGLIMNADRDFTSYTGILLILTLAKAFSYWDHFNPTCVPIHFKLPNFFY
jgi:hypothetical protein